MPFPRPLLLLTALPLLVPALTCAAETTDTPPPTTQVTLAPTTGMRTEFIFEEAPFPSCHASTIAEGKTGLVAAWFGGRLEGDSSVGIWLARQVGGQWSAPVEVANGTTGEKRYPCWNPVLFQPKTGPLMLFYKVGPDTTRWWGMVATSQDSGATWSAPRRLPQGILGPIKNKPIQYGNAILAPSSTEGSGWQVHFERSDDGGQTWTRGENVNDGKGIGAIQPSLLPHPDGSLQAIGRTRQGKLFTITSPDGGQTWGRMTLLKLPNPNSGTDALTLRDGRFLLVYNHTPTGRSPLNVAVSDDGQTWKPVLTLENGAGEYSYPAVIQTQDGLVHITYTWQRARIKHVVLDPNTLR